MYVTKNGNAERPIPAVDNQIGGSGPGGDARYDAGNSPRAWFAPECTPCVRGDPIVRRQAASGMPDGSSQAAAGDTARGRMRTARAPSPRPGSSHGTRPSSYVVAIQPPGGQVSGHPRGTHHRPKKFHT